MGAVEQRAPRGRAYELVGYPAWDAGLVADVREHVERLTANRRESVMLGKPLDAAIADPRWLVAGTLGGG